MVGVILDYGELLNTEIGYIFLLNVNVKVFYVCVILSLISAIVCIMTQWLLLADLLIYIIDYI